MDQIKVRVNNGYLVATASCDSLYPGIDVEYIADEESEEHVSAPRILFEYPKGGELQALVWTDKHQEDYTHKLSSTPDEAVVEKSLFAIIQKIVQDEYNVFMNEMLRKESRDIFDCAKKIDVYSELHGYILDMISEEFTAQQVEELLSLDSILDTLYRTYLDNDYLHCNTYEDTKQILDYQLELIESEDE